MKKLLLLFVLFIFACSSEDNNGQPSNSSEPTNENMFSFVLDTSSEFPVGHNLGLNYFNDITVGVISNSPNQIKLITAANTSSYIISGTSLSNLTQFSQVASPQENTFYSNYVGLGQLIIDSNNTIYSVFNSEEHDGSILPGNIPGFYASVGLAISSDNGQTFQLNTEPLIQNVYDSSFDNGYAEGAWENLPLPFQRTKQKFSFIMLTIIVQEEV